MYPFTSAGPASPLWGMGTTEATLRMENMEVKDEWQDEDFPRWVALTFSKQTVMF